MKHFFCQQLCTCTVRGVAAYACDDELATAKLCGLQATHAEIADTLHIQVNTKNTDGFKSAPYTFQLSLFRIWTSGACEERH